MDLFKICDAAKAQMELDKAENEVHKIFEDLNHPAHALNIIRAFAFQSYIL